MRDVPGSVHRDEGDSGPLPVDGLREAFLPFHSPLIEEDDIDGVVDTLRSGWITTGPRVREFESEVAGYVGTKHAVALNSCTAALHLALLAAGVHPGDEVITSPYTFASTAAVIEWIGARPVFVDIDSATFNMDVSEIESRITPKTRAIVPVHIAGQPCDMDLIMGLARDHGLAVIEDAAHAFSAQYRGRMIGTIGDFTAFSFYATKNLTTAEGGMVVTGNHEAAEKMRLLSLHGMSRDAWQRYDARGSWYYEVLEAGYKYNMTDIQASLGLSQLRKIGRCQAIRERYARMYSEAFVALPQVGVPLVRDDVVHAWHLYVIQLDLEKLTIDRAGFIEALKALNVGTSVHFIPLHMQPYYRNSYGYKPDDFPRARQVYERAVSLPLYPRMTEDDVRYVIRAVTEVATRHSIA